MARFPSDYINQHGLAATGSTPRYISIQSLKQLPQELEERDVMVLRFGSAPSGTGTQFLLVEAESTIREFFLSDTELFEDHPTKALGEALALDTTDALLPPATGRSTFRFDLKPHSAYETVVTHNDGQVEIDTLFAERRNGNLAMFVIEAKTEGLDRRLPNIS